MPSKLLHGLLAAVAACAFAATALAATDHSQHASAVDRAREDPGLPGVRVPRAGQVRGGRPGDRDPDAGVRGRTSVQGAGVRPARRVVAEAAQAPEHPDQDVQRPVRRRPRGSHRDSAPREGGRGSGSSARARTSRCARISASPAGCATASPQPLRVKAGDYIGLTAVTWLPAFAVNLDAPGNSWLASRTKRRCATPASSRPKQFEKYYKRNDAQLQASTVKQYDCSYQTARLLYWARIVPDAAPPATPSPSASAGARVLLAELLEALGRAAAGRRRVVLLGVLPGAQRRRRVPGCAGAGVVGVGRAAGLVLVAGLVRSSCGRGWCACSIVQGRAREAAPARAPTGLCCRRHRRRLQPAITTPTSSPVTTAAIAINANLRAGGSWDSGRRGSGGMRLPQYGQSLRSRPDELARSAGRSAGSRGSGGGSKGCSRSARACRRPPSARP